MQLRSALAPEPTHEPAKGEDAPLSARPVSSCVEVALPMPVNHAWVAYACRSAGVAKPRWNPAARVWTTTATTVKGETAVAETISITVGGTGSKSVRVRAEWDPTDEDDAYETATTRRLITAFLTGMQWAVRQRS